MWFCKLKVTATLGYLRLDENGKADQCSSAAAKSSDGESSEIEGEVVASRALR